MLRSKGMLVPFAAALVLAACSDTHSIADGLDASSITASDAKFPPNVASITISPTTGSVAVGSILKMKVTSAKTADGQSLSTSSLTVTWTSSDRTVGTVSKEGSVGGLQNGVVTITATVGNASANAVITVGSGSTTTTSSTTSTSTTTTSSTTTTPTTTTSTTTTTSGTGVGVSSAAMIYDNFSTYSSTTAFLANVSSALGGTAAPSTAKYNDGFNINLVSIDNTVLYNGHSTMKYTQHGGTDSTPSLTAPFPRGLTKFWLRVKLRWSPGFTTDGVTANYGKGYKIFGWGWNGTDGRGSLELGSISQYYTVWAVYPRDGSPNSGTPDMIAGNIQNEWTDGGWYDYIICYEQTSSTTIRQRWWLAKDGSTPVLRSTQTGTMTSGTVPTANRVMLGLNFNQQRAATQNQAIWYGQWEVVDGTQTPDPFGLGG